MATFSAQTPDVSPVSFTRSGRRYGTPFKVKTKKRKNRRATSSPKLAPAQSSSSEDSFSSTVSSNPSYITDTSTEGVTIECGDSMVTETSTECTSLEGGSDSTLGSTLSSHHTMSSSTLMDDTVCPNQPSPSEGDGDQATPLTPPHATPARQATPDVTERVSLLFRTAPLVANLNTMGRRLWNCGIVSRTLWVALTTF